MTDRIRAISTSGQPQAWTPVQLKGWATIVISDVAGLQTQLDGKAALSGGYIASAQLPGFTGDVTAAPGSLTLTIAAQAVTLGKLAPQATSTLLGNNTGGSASPSALTAAQAKTLLNIAYTDVSGLSAIAHLGDAQYLTGTVPAGALPVFGGDLFSVGNTNSISIAANAVSLNKMAQLPARTVIANPTGGSASGQYVTMSTLKSMLGYQISEIVGVATVAITNSYLDLSNRPTIPSGQVNSDWNASSGVAQILNKPVLAAVATTGAAADLTGTLAVARLPALTGGDVTSSLGSSVLTIGTGVVTLAKLAAIGANSIVGNATGSSAVPTALTGTQVTGLIDVFGTSTKGLVPAPGATLGYALADNGTWQPYATLQQAMLYSIIFG